MSGDLTLTALVPYAITGGGVVDLTCTRCGDAKVFRPGDDKDVALIDLAIWAATTAAGRADDAPCR